MSLHPEFQIRAQKEIDIIVNSGRLPDFDDRDDFPFVNAIIQETLRWNPASLIELYTMMFMKDFIFPQRSIIDPDADTIYRRAVTHDEALYGPNPDAFNPDRFMQVDSKPPDPELFAFGFGRRICPGRYLAMNTIYLTVAHLLATFTIAKAIDGDGNEVEPVAEFTPNFISHPKPFKCRFIPRKA
ncbi:hypothetical protein PQX77_001438 [Marasmius sp. AFHP31]|nr:hypothetical protein PQX77_001438 [Marasmius sp. AFHP31]